MKALVQVAAILVGALLFWFIGSAVLAHVAHADAAPTPPAAGFDWRLWGGIVVAFGTAASLFLHWLAPRTETTVDDAIRDDLDKALAMIQELRGNAAPVPPIIVRVPPDPPTSTGGGTAAMLAVLLLGGALSMQACAGTGAVVKREASYLEGCSAADAATIIAAGKALADDAKALKAGGDRAAAATDVIVQLALINAAWQHCKATAEQPVASAEVL